MRPLIALALVPFAIHSAAAQGTRAGGATADSARTYFEFQVTKKAWPKPGNLAPRYPDSLRDAHIEGEVLVQFVVDTTGHADMDQFRVLRSTHPLFSDAVKAALPSMEFTPAELGGSKVRQLVQMPFHFSITPAPL